MAITVTAAQGGTGAADGIALTVKVVTGALAPASQPGTTFSDDTTLTVPQHASTPAATGSWIYGAVTDSFAATAFTANGSTTFSQNVTDSGAGLTMGTFRSTSTTTAATPVTVGGSAPTETAGAFNFAVAEIKASGTLAEDPSSPAVASTIAATTISTASFTPAGGALLVAMVSCNYTGSGTLTMGVSDSSSLTWTQLASETHDLASVWIAQVPSGAVTSTGSAHLAALGVSGAALVPYTSTGAPGLPVLGMSGSAGVLPPITISGSLGLGAAGITAGIIPPQMEVFADIPSGIVTSGGTTSPAAGTAETWTVTAIAPFPAASASGSPVTFFYAADPANPYEMLLVTACPGGASAGQSWTVTRGADGTTPITHGPASFIVVQVVTHASYRALQAVRGTAVLSSGTVTVACSTITAASLIYLTSQYDGGTPGWLRISSRVPGVSFTITSSSGTDGSTVAYAIS